MKELLLYIGLALVLFGPVLLVAMGLARLARDRASRRAGAEVLAALEAQHGTLSGRTGTVEVDTPKDGFPLPRGTVRRAFVDGDLRLPLVDAASSPPPGSRVRIVEVRVLRPGEVPYVPHGVGVRVAPADG